MSDENTYRVTLTIEVTAEYEQDAAESGWEYANLLTNGGASNVQVEEVEQVS